MGSGDFRENLIYYISNLAILEVCFGPLADSRKRRFGRECACSCVRRPSAWIAPDPSQRLLSCSQPLRSMSILMGALKKQQAHFVLIKKSKKSKTAFEGTGPEPRAGSPGHCGSGIGHLGGAHVCDSGKVGQFPSRILPFCGVLQTQLAMTFKSWNYLSGATSK